MREWNKEGSRDPQGGGLYMDICAALPEFLVTPLLVGPVCLLSHSAGLKSQQSAPENPCLQLSSENVWRRQDFVRHAWYTTTHDTTHPSAHGGPQKRRQYRITNKINCVNWFVKKPAGGIIFFQSNSSAD